MVGNSMFDNRKSQTGATGLLGMALIDPIEPFKDPILMLGRDANTGIFHD